VGPKDPLECAFWPPKPTCQEVFTYFSVVNNLVFRCPKPLFFYGFWGLMVFIVFEIFEKVANSKSFLYFDGKLCCGFKHFCIFTPHPGGNDPI